MLDVMLELGAIVLDERAHRHRGRVAQRADRSALDVVGHRVQQVEILGTPFTVFDPVNDAIQPSCAFAARRALAAAFLEIEIGQPLGGSHHAARLVHHDDRAGAEHRARLRDRVVVHVGRHHHVARHHRHRRTAGNHALIFLPSRMPPASSSRLRERRSERDLVVARICHVAGDGEDLRAAVVRPADLAGTHRRRG